MAFIGQTMASTTMLCVHKNLTTDMSMLSHHNHDISSVDDAHGKLMVESSKKSNDMDCCQEQCQCSMSGCFSLSVLLDNTFNSLLKGEQKIVQLSSLPLIQVNTSLYRPPIS